MMTIVGLSGSLRQNSFNSALLGAAASLVPEKAELRIRSISDIPLYNGDLEAEQGLPTPVEQLKDEIIAADGLLICTPEYNNSMPGVLKNAIDWLSRPPADIPRVFGGLPVAIMGATPGRFGTVLAQNAWLPVFHTLGVRFWNGGRLMVPGASKVIDADGELTDDNIRKRLEKFMQDFVGFVEASRQTGGPGDER